MKSGVGVGLPEGEIHSIVVVFEGMCKGQRVKSLSRI
jgi:hypothetical protein